MNNVLIKNSIKVCKLLEHFYELDKVHVYIENDIASFASHIYYLYQKFRGNEKTYCIDVKHYVNYKRKYSNFAKYNICLSCEQSDRNDIVIDKSEIFSKHLIKIILKLNHFSDMDDKTRENTLNDWYFVEDNIFQRRFDNYKKAHKCNS